MTATANDVTVLNSLIAALVDSIDGYEESAEHLENESLANKFYARADERQSAVAKLQAAVLSAGGKPEDDGTTLAGARRVFVNLKAAVSGNDDKAIVSEVERGEDHLKDNFEKALADTDLSPAARGAAEEAWQSLRAGHDEMSALKHSMGG